MSDALTLLPPLLAIAFAVAFRSVYGALILALLLSEALIGGGVVSGLSGLVERVVGVFGSAYNTKVLLFALLIGAMIALARESGGVAAAARALLSRGGVKTPRRAELTVAGLGTAVFVETNVSLLSTGILGRPLYDAHGLSRERLAYVIDSTCAPVSVLVLVNGWGAYAIGLVSGYGLDNPSSVVFATIPLNFYPIAALALVYLTAVTGRVFGPLRTADARAEEDVGDAKEGGRALYMWLPLAALVIGALGFLFLTGGGNIAKGDGASAILWAVILATILAALAVRVGGAMSGEEVRASVFGGMGEMIPLVSVLLLAIALGASLGVLGTGEVVARAASGALPPFLVPLVLFLAAGIASFTTGTSWGTYGLLVPIALPLAEALGVPLPLALAAVLGGGVFGDHCSPISDTTLIASVASGCDHLSHVTTQMPYALTAGGIASGLYLLAGLVVV